MTSTRTWGTFFDPCCGGGAKWRPFRFRPPSWMTSFAGTGNEVIQDGGRKRKGRHLAPPPQWGSKKVPYTTSIGTVIATPLSIWHGIKSLTRDVLHLFLRNIHIYICIFIISKRWKQILSNVLCDFDSQMYALPTQLSLADHHALHGFWFTRGALTTVTAVTVPELRR